jgi:hypothetical protein
MLLFHGIFHPRWLAVHRDSPPAAPRNCRNAADRLSFGALIVLAVGLAGNRVVAEESTPFRLAVFSAEVTIPRGHRCMGLLPTKSQRIVDPLYAHGLVLLSADDPIVLCAVDWCEIRNGAYDQWRDALAAAAGTTRQRVLVSALHQHDAPVVDSGAARLLREAGLPGELYDERFHDQTVARVAEALKLSLPQAKPITHIGLGQARIDAVASNRRIEYPDGRVAYDRGSRSQHDKFLAAAPVGLIDPLLKTISFWNEQQPIAALHSYATHPMSYYGNGEVTSDFVGLAREQRRRDDLSIQQIYVSGCSGDITAGKFNDGSPAKRIELTARIYQGLVDAWHDTTVVPLAKLEFRHTELVLDYHPNPNLTVDRLEQSLHDPALAVEKRIHAAMSLATRQRLASDPSIDLPCIDLGPAQIVLFPAEAFVAYQLMAQKLRPESFVMSIGYGECWPGYIPTQQAFEENFADQWLWTAPGAEQRIQQALGRVLQ